MKKVKQISYFSALVISVGSTIGAGIFFKNSEIFKNAGGSLAFTIAAWVIAAFGLMAIGLSLVEVSSASKSDGGILEWVKKFAPKKFSKFAASYMLLIYLPLNYFAIPIYATMSFDDAMGGSLNGWTIAIIAFCIFAWVATMSFFSLKSAERFQWVFTIAKFIPLVALPFIGLVQAGDNGVSSMLADSTTTGLAGISPWLGIMASIPAILFAFDGFYTVTALKSKLKDEKKMGSVIALSISVITATYLFFAISLGIAGAKSHYDLGFINNHKWLMITSNVLIMMAVMGIANGFAMATVPMYLTVHKEEKLGIVGFFKRLFKIKSDRHAAFATSVIIAGLSFVLLIPIAIFGMSAGGEDYTQSARNIFSVADHVTNFTSLIVFIFIGFAIAGALHNRKTNAIEVKKSRFFKVYAWISIIFLAIGIIYMLTSSIVDMTGFNGANATDAAVKFGILIFTTLISIIPGVWPSIKLRLKKTKTL